MTAPVDHATGDGRLRGDAGRGGPGGDLPGGPADPLAEPGAVGGLDVEPALAPPSPDEAHLLDAGAVEVLRRGLAVTPELRQGIAITVVMAAATAAGKLAVPVLIQQILDRGVLGPAGFRAGFVYPACAATAVVVVALYLVARATYLRLVRTAEASLMALRVRAFDHIHRLSMAEHNEQRRGALVARVTSDIETLALFMEWGAVAWIVNSVMIVATFAVMAAYEWRLAAVALVAFAPLVVLLPMLQRRQLAAQDRVRTAVGESLSEVSETITGAPLIQAYGLEERARARLRGAIDRQYRAYLQAARYFSLMFPLGDLFGALALAGVVTAGVVWGPGWGLEVGEVVAFTFLIGLLLTPIAELTEIVDQTQTAIAGWRKVLGVLATPLDVPEPDDGRVLPAGALDVAVDGLSFAYRDGVPVLHDVDVRVPAGSSVAIVGETGSGKTTFAKLLCRLADPTAGTVRLAGVDLRTVAPASRRRAVRLVPQDGFLFDATIADNVRVGRPAPPGDGGTGDGGTGDGGTGHGGDADRHGGTGDGGTGHGGDADRHGGTGDGGTGHGGDADRRDGDGDVRAAFAALGLGWWLDELPLGAATRVGERGSNLSVGERQLVALARAQLGDPGLLVLDEATSAVDAETERALAQALDRLSEGRTMVSIAHRLTTAESADLVLVFAGGRLVERGTHAELVTAGGTYASLHRSWLGNTREPGDPAVLPAGGQPEAGGPTAPMSDR